jgi:hypothetical protein
MPSAHIHVETPPELDKRIPLAKPKTPVVQKEAPWWIAVMSLVVLVLATALMGVGVGLWVGLGAGLTTGGACLFIIGIMLARTGSEEEGGS